MSKYEYQCACGAEIARSKATGQVPLSCITCRLARVEADMATLRRAHAAAATQACRCGSRATREGDCWVCDTCGESAPVRGAAPEYQEVYEAGRERGHKESETWVLSAVLRSGEAPEVLTPEAQDARSWARIEAWHASITDLETLEVSFAGPFNEKYAPHFFYCRLPGGHAARGNTRSDALAHAAQWCENQMQIDQPKAKP